MKSPKNVSVRQFLEELRLIDERKFEIISELRKIVYDEFPEVEERIMYGGIIFSIDNDMFSGVFAYKNHVSMEFSNGYLMEDPDKLLEGKGKFRRHVKMESLADVGSKHVLYFVQQAKKHC